MKRIAIAVLFCAAVVVPGVASAHGHKSKTKLGAPMYYPTSGNQHKGVLYGTIVGKQKCVDKRTVIVYRKESGKDKEIGSDKATPAKGAKLTYAYNVPTKHMVTAKYYAVAPSTSKCAGERSKSAKLSPVLP